MTFLQIYLIALAVIMSLMTILWFVSIRVVSFLNTDGCEMRKNVEDIWAEGTYALTTLRAGIIVGSGSASFETIRNLVEKLPIMITPPWLKTKCQPIAIRNVVEYFKWCNWKY